MTVQQPVIDMWAPIVPSTEIMNYVAPTSRAAELAVFAKLEVTPEHYAEAASAMARDDEDILLELDAAEHPPGVLLESLLSAPRTANE